MVFTSVVMMTLLSGAYQAAAFDVPYPPNAVTGGTVVAEVSGQGGEIRVLSGEEPFSSAVRSSAASWRFPGDSRKHLVIVRFRQPELVRAGSRRETVPVSTGGSGAMPYPQSVTEPAYPPDALGEGSVALKVKLTASGAVDRIETLQSLGKLTETGIDAVREWSFQPARDSRGRAVPSEAYVVLVYRAPVLSPSRPR
jgi:TonB family protein